MENKHTRSVSLIDGHTEEMTDAEVITAMEDYRNSPIIFIKKGIISIGDIIDLIKRQQAEIEKLNVELVGMRGACESYKIHYDNAQAEIKRLNGLLIENDKAFNKMTELYKKAFNRCKTAKSEAIKEFAKRLTDRICEHIEQSLGNPNGNNYFITDVYTDINNLVKEMTEVKENG